MSRPSNQQPLGDVERSLFRLYVNCQLLGISPDRLHQEYDFNYEQLAMIAGCSVPTMTRWMAQGREPHALKEIGSALKVRMLETPCQHQFYRFTAMWKDASICP